MESAFVYLVVLAGLGLAIAVVCSLLGHLLSRAQQSSPRKQVLGWGLVAFLVTALFPPYEYQYGTGVRYGCLLSDPPWDSSGAIAGGRLLLEWLVLGVILFVVYQFAGDRPGNLTPAAVPPAAPPEEKRA